MRTRLAPLIVVKQEPKDELGPLDELNGTTDDNNNNNNSSFLHSTTNRGGEGGGGDSPRLLLPPPPPNSLSVVSSVVDRPPGSNSFELDDSNNNKSSEVNKNIFGGVRNGSPFSGQQNNELFLRSVVDGIKVEKCFYATTTTNDRNNNICDWTTAEESLVHQIKAEPASHNNLLHHQNQHRIHPSEEPAERKSMYPKMRPIVVD